MKTNSESKEYVNGIGWVDLPKTPSRDCICLDVIGNQIVESYYDDQGRSGHVELCLIDEAKLITNAAIQA